MLNTVSERLAEREMKLEVTDAARDFLGEKGYDEVFGARPLRRLIQDMVEDRLSEGLLGGNFQSGDTVIVDLKEGEIIVNPQAVSALPGEGKPKS